MGWGTSEWGTGGWGAEDGTAPPTLLSSSPSVVSHEGGTVVRLVGDYFRDPMTIEILTGTLGSYVVVGAGYIPNPRYDISPSEAFFGTPALAADVTYHVRITTASGSVVLENAFTSRVLAEEFKVHAARGKYAPAWETGLRLLRGG